MTNKITTYGLIGYPLDHSLSPIMQNTAFRALDVDAIYRLFPLQEQDIEEFLKGMRQEDSEIFGINVTVPYKEKVIPFLDSLSPFAKKAGAVNTIEVTEKKKLIGHNTDGPGFLAHIGELGFDPLDTRIAIIGGGGASRALISALCLSDRKPSSIRLYDIDREKAQALIHDLGQRFDVGCVEIVNSIDDLNIELADCLINATPLGLKPDDEVLVDEALLHANLFVYDLIYNPAQTPLLAMAERKGAKTSNGLGMLLYQGVLALSHWAKMDIPDSVREQMRISLDIREVI